MKNKTDFPIKFCYLGKDYTICLKKDDSPIVLRNSIMKVYYIYNVNRQELNSHGYCIFLSDVDIQDESFFSTSENGRKMLLKKPGFIIPVLPVKQEKEYAVNTSIELANVNDLFHFFDDIHYGKYANHENLEIIFSMSKNSILFQNIPHGLI